MTQTRTRPQLDLTEHAPRQTYSRKPSLNRTVLPSAANFGTPFSKESPNPSNPVLHHKYSTVKLKHTNASGIDL